MAGRGARTGAETIGCDTGDMRVIHGLFRMIFTDAPGLVRGVADGDVERVAVVAEHVAESLGGLHNHHTTEDLLLWDRLEGRAPACAMHVALMRSQHAAVAKRAEELGPLLEAWRRSAGADDGERVAAALDDVHRLLEEHFGDEEERILPVASRTLTQTEWDALGEHGRASIPRDRLLIQLGWILASFESAEERQRWVRHNLPLPVRAMFAVVGRRQFEAQRRRLLGEQTSA